MKNPQKTVEANGLTVRVITPHSGLEAFRYAMASLITDWPTARALAWRMFVRDTKASYRHSFLGYVWLLLPALANTLVWVFLNNQKVVNIDSGAAPYPLFVFCGTVLWTAFNTSLIGAMGVVQTAGGTLSKVNFPHEALILNEFGKSLLNTLATAIFVVPFLLIFPVPLGWHSLLFPVGILATMIFGTAVGLLTVPITALFSDLSRAIHLGMRFAFFLTPVIFPVPAGGWGRTLFLCNPVTHLLVTSRSWLIGGESMMLSGFLVVTATSLVLLFVGVIAFKVSLPHIIERLSS
ncbi:MAG: ABC transporter permease [Planctomycetaceae bacterium]|nr:ABC transporter permease [Planctomycetaceae bacterium]